jgi:putative membrane protein
MNQPKNQIKYAQQHLANERTYLAWIRTAIAIVGIGFLTTSLHFTIGLNRNAHIDQLAIILGLTACLLGFITTLLATANYFHKKKQILNESFSPSNGLVIFVTCLMCFIILIVIMYFLFVKF